MNFLKKFGLVTRIFMGLAVGAGLGLLVNITQITWLNFIEIFGTLYIGSLKALAPILVFVLVLDSIAGSSGSKKQTADIKQVIVLYFASCFLAAMVAVISSFMFKVPMPGLKTVTAGAATVGLWESTRTVLLSIVSNPVTAVVNGNYLAILLWAVVFGTVLRTMAPTSKIMLHDLAAGISKVIQGVVAFAPLGVFGLVFETVSTNGASIFVEYGKLIFILVTVMLVVALLFNPLIVGIVLRKNPYPLVFKCLTKSGINAFFTRSSAANIPINMNLCEEMGVDKGLYSVTIPLGATINMAGAAITITVLTLSTAWAQNMDISFGYALAMCFVATLAAAGTAGTAGGSLMLVPLACFLFGIGPDLAWYAVGVGGTIGFIQDSLETAINSSSDVLFTATVDMSGKNK